MAWPTVTTSRVGAAGASMPRTLPPRPLRRDLVLALVEGGDEVVVGAGEGADALPLDGQGQVVVVDPGGGEAVDHGPGAVDAAFHRVGLGVAVVVQRLDRGGGPGGFRFFPGRAVEAERVGGPRVLWLGRPPPRPLGPGGA